MKRQRFNLLFAVMIVFAVGLFGQDRSTPTRLTSHPAQEGFATWSPDGKSLFFSRFSRQDTLGENGIWKVSLDNKKVTQVFSGIAEHPKVSPDGRFRIQAPA